MTGTFDQREGMEVRGLTTRFYVPGGVVNAVNGISFSVKRGRTLGIVGESGCGKSVTVLSLLGLVSYPGVVEGGEVWLGGRDLLTLSPKQLRSVRGNEVSMVFQDPQASLNPIFTVGSQLTETIRAHRQMTGAAARSMAVHLLETVGLRGQGHYYSRYPFQLSGGQCQRVMIAMALSLSPKILIADEPTTALDVTIQFQILDELNRLKEEFDTGVILITHNLALVAQWAQDVAVMYAGSIVERGPVSRVFSHPTHPYTMALLASLPRMGQRHKTLHQIGGKPPSLVNLFPGCPFAPRCPYASDICREEMPSLVNVARKHMAACHQNRGREALIS